MNPAVAIIGMACLYPDAKSPGELWENVLAQRQAFRRIPDERLRLDDYLSSDRHASDCIYSTEAAVIEGYEFDRVRFRVVGDTFRSADLTHWVALDIAAQALADAEFREGENLPRDTTGVFLGNTLTGEFSRANLMRLRWPYVRRVVEAALIKEKWSAEERRSFLKDLKTIYQEPFPLANEETLAGGLSNTIAGRICNHFNLKGGGYTVDGACASSLLAVTSACSALVLGDLDVALAGGVDLSLDPFELVGFSRAGALAGEKMRVYDTRSAGFWPGEGCGFVVLMRYEEAVAQQRHIYANIRGWGISSDGSGGMTRPEVEGQLLALNRAYQRAGFSTDTVAYFEGHGTGTSVGDATELQALSRARRQAACDVYPAVIGTIKANIGHTKAAAGVAGLIKTTMALTNQILPPTTGCEEPHSELRSAKPVLRVLREGEPWPTELPLRAGISAMGFGGINAHLAIEGVSNERRKAISDREQTLLSSAQDAELLLMEGQGTSDLLQQIDHLLTFSAKLSRAEMADLTAHIARRLGGCHWRAAVVATTPAELTNRLETLRSWLMNGEVKRLDVRAGIFLGVVERPPHVGFLFPGQGSSAHLSGGALRRRFKFVRELYDWANLPTCDDGIHTAVAQPAIVTASMAGLRALGKLGITACVAVGHSLGEITALHWAGALDEQALLRIASARGKAMMEMGNSNGAMASIGAGQQEVTSLSHGHQVVIAGLNSPRQTVISGEASAIRAFVARAQTRGLQTVMLPVSHAFHSPLVAAAAPLLADQLSSEKFQSLQRQVVSTVTGETLSANEDLRELLYRQVISPVRFIEAVNKAVEGLDLLIEVGPGHVLTGLVSEFRDLPIVAVDAGGPSLKGLLQAVGSAYVLGVPVKHDALFTDRFTRPFDLNWHPRFFVNPCELAPTPENVAGKDTDCPKEHEGELESESEEPLKELHPLSATTPPFEIVRHLVAERTELPISAVSDDHRLLADLHMNSISVSQLVVEAARQLGLPPPIAPTDYSNATVAHVAQAFEDLLRTGNSFSESSGQVSGVDSWIRTFTVELVERPLPRRQAQTGQVETVWRLIATPDYPLTESLQQAFSRCGGEGGVVVCLSPSADESHVSLLLEGARAVLTESKLNKFVLVQHGGGAASFARSLHLEAKALTTCVIDVPVDHPKAVEWVLTEVMAAAGFSEAHYDEFGGRREPLLKLMPLLEESDEIPLGPNDLLLVTGGGKGIAAECALSLARETDVRLVLLGRSLPDNDLELRTNLERMAAAGTNFRYVAADVIDAEAVRAVLHAVQEDSGPITAILHSAGTNVPQLLGSLNEEDFLRTLAPKVQGACNVLAAVNPDTLRLLITFGSLIARTGMRGEADYAVANEWLTRLTERWQAEHPRCRCLNIEWSVWAGAGMGERLGRVDALIQQGITPIPVDEGIRILNHLLGRRLPLVSVVVTGRYGEALTLKREQPELPFLRFLEQPKVYYPGVELIADAELSLSSDPYVDDHVFQGQRLFPAVMGLEAMAQAAMGLAKTDELPVFEEVKFSRPVTVPDKETVTIRLAAFVRKPDEIEVALRSKETAYKIDHFRAVCRFGMRNGEVGTRIVDPHDSGAAEEEIPPVGLDPDRDLYGGILFHQGRFRRLQCYRRLRATECIAEIKVDEAVNWFSRYLPATLVLGDPGARDACLHAVQACIPHVTLLPVGVERIVLGRLRVSGSLFVNAHERSREGQDFIYDLEITGEDGQVHERWQGVRLHSIQRGVESGPWVEALMGPYLERCLEDLVPEAAVAVVVERNNTAERSLRSDQAIRRALGARVKICRRPDGKPEICGNNKREVSVAHAGDLTLAVSGHGRLGCDLEPVIVRSASEWLDLLGRNRYALAEVIARHLQEDPATAATRVWAASESMKKAGAMGDAPLLLASSEEDGWVKLKSGSLTIATFAASVRSAEHPLVIAVLVGDSGMSINKEL